MLCRQLVQLPPPAAAAAGGAAAPPSLHSNAPPLRCSSLRHKQPRLEAYSSGSWASPNYFDISPLAFAAWRGDAARVAALLEQPSARQELHLRDKEGWTVLHFAVRGGSPVCIRLLAQAGADVHAVVPGGRQALHWAAAGASADCCVELLLAGALPTAPDSSGRSAEQLAQRRLQHEQAAEEQAPYQRPAGALAEARKVLALLQAAVGGQLPIASSEQLPVGTSSSPTEAALTLASSDAAPDTPQLGSRVASCRTLDDAASVASSSAADGSSDSTSGGEEAQGVSSGQPAEAGSQRCQGGSAGGSPAARRECRVCLQEGQDLRALIPCGHRVACAACCARLLLPGIMARLAASSGGAGAADGAAGASVELCRCPVCRAEVRAWAEGWASRLWVAPAGLQSVQPAGRHAHCTAVPPLTELSVSVHPDGCCCAGDWQPARVRLLTLRARTRHQPCYGPAARAAAKRNPDHQHCESTASHPQTFMCVPLSVAPHKPFCFCLHQRVTPTPCNCFSYTSAQACL